MSVPDSYNVNFITTAQSPASDTPIQQFHIGAAQIIGNQAPITPTPAPYTNPTSVYWDDPLHSGKQSHAAVAFPSAFGDYQMNLSGLVSGAEGPRSSAVAITIAPVPPPAPTGVIPQ